MIQSFAQAIQISNTHSALRGIGISVEDAGYIGDIENLFKIQSLKEKVDVVVVKEDKELGIVELYFPLLDCF
jgi:hypothetical protein